MKTNNINKKTSARIPVIILFFIVIMAGMQIKYFYPILPDEVISQFGLSGNASEVSGKSSFVLTYAKVVMGLLVLFPGVSILIHILPVSIMNLPYKEYWFAESREKYTRGLLSLFFLWFGNVTLIFVVFVMHLCIIANLKPYPELDASAMIAFGVYIVFVIIWLGMFILKFNKVTDCDTGNNNF